MKSKKITGTLGLNKTTIANLNARFMSGIKGGTIASVVVCAVTQLCNTSFNDPCDCNTSHADPCNCW